MQPRLPLEQCISLTFSATLLWRSTVVELVHAVPTFSIASDSFLADIASEDSTIEKCPSISLYIRELSVVRDVQMPDSLDVVVASTVPQTC
jgi:hypothetical protein